MNLISKVKKIAVCGVASLGLLVSTGNLGLSAMNPYPFSGFGMTNRGSDFAGFSNQDAERIRASRSAAPQNATTYNATTRVSLPAITVGGRNVRDLDEREKIELTRRGLALYAKGNITWNEVAMLLEISPSTLQNWVRLYEEGAVARYTAQEKRAHILKYLKEHKMFDSTSADYAERHGLLVSTFKKWLNDYKI